MTFLSNWKSSARAVKIAVLVLMSDMAESGLRPVAEMAALDTGVRWLEPNEVGDLQYVCCVFLQSMSLPVFTTGAIVAAYSERQDMISLVPDSLLSWGGHYRPLLHETCTTSIIACVAYYLQMSSWFVWQMH